MCPTCESLCSNGQINTILQTTFPTPMFFFFKKNLAINVSPDQAIRYAAPHQDRLCLYMYMSQLWVGLLKRAKCTNFSNTEVLSNIVGPLARRCVMYRIIDGAKHGDSHVLLRLPLKETNMIRPRGYKTILSCSSQLDIKLIMLIIVGIFTFVIMIYKTS